MRRRGRVPYLTTVHVLTARVVLLLSSWRLARALAYGTAVVSPRVGLVRSPELLVSSLVLAFPSCFGVFRWSAVVLLWTWVLVLLSFCSPVCLDGLSLSVVLAPGGVWVSDLTRGSCSCACLLLACPSLPFRRVARRLLSGFGVAARMSCLDVGCSPSCVGGLLMLLLSCWSVLRCRLSFIVVSHLSSSAAHFWVGGPSLYRSFVLLK